MDMSDTLAAHDDGDGDRDDGRDGAAPVVPQIDEALTSLSLRQIEDRLSMLTPEITIDDMVFWLDGTAVLLSRVKQMRQAFERLAVRWVQEHGPITIGDVCYTAGVNSTTRCLDRVRCAQLVLQACGG